MFLLNIITAADNDEINKEPARILIDNRLDIVKDWDIIEKLTNDNIEWPNEKIIIYLYFFIQ